MEILNKELVEEDGTAKITVRKKDGSEMNVYVQTVDSVYRTDLGCIIYTDYGEFSTALLDNEEDVDTLIKEAEKLIADSYEIHYVKPGYIFKVFNDRVILSEENPRFVNADSSSYQLEYFDIEEFETLEEAKKFLKSMPKGD